MAGRAAELGGQISTAPFPGSREELPYDIRVARGLVTGNIVITMNARSVTAITATSPDWTDISSHTVLHPDVNFTPRVASDNAADDAGGTGALTVFIWGMPVTRDQVESLYQPPWQSELITMDGVTPVLGLLEYRQIDGAQVVGVGDTGYNEGAITVGVQGGVDLVTIPAERGQSRRSRLSIPENWGAVVRQIQPFWTGGNPVMWELRQHNEGVERTLFDGEAVASNSGLSVPVEGGISIDPGATIWFRARRIGGSPLETMQINAFVDMFLIDDGALPDTLPLP